MKEETLEISYTLILDENTKRRLLRIAEDMGYDHGDAGKLLTIRRLLMHEGLDGAFPDEYQQDIKLAKTVG